MVSNIFKTFLLVLPVMLSASLGAQELAADNPLTPYAFKSNGKALRKFTVPYSVLKDYFAYVGNSTILENSTAAPLMDLDFETIDTLPEDLEFEVDLKTKKAYPTSVISPHSISHLFIVDPISYISQSSAEDFLTAKRELYGVKVFNRKKLRYDRDMVHLEDWRSLNHPPVEDLGDDLTVWDKNYVSIDYKTHESTFYSKDFHDKIDELSGSELTFGNKIEFLSNGDSYKRKVSEIRNAKKSVLMAVMSFYCDSSSRLLEDTLIEKVRQGVDVKLMVEQVWTKLVMMKCMNRMIEGGVDVVYANDLLKKGEASALFHNKFIVIDNSKVIMGGSNIIESENDSTGFNHMNRDNDLYIEGPLATDALYEYTRLWRKFSTGRNQRNVKRNPNIKEISFYEVMVNAQLESERLAGSRGKNLYQEILSNPETRNKGVCRFMTQDPATDKYRLSKVFIAHINEAKERMNMTAGKLNFELPTDSEKKKAKESWNKNLFDSIFAKTESGVKLDIIGNGIDGGYGEISNMVNSSYLRRRFKFRPITKAIQRLVINSFDHGAAKKNQPYLEHLQKKDNVRAWSNFQYMHSKLIQLDRTMNIVSSYNLENWSADKSHEMATLCLDESLSHAMDRSFLRDFANSVPAATH